MCRGGQQLPGPLQTAFENIPGGGGALLGEDAGEVAFTDAHGPRHPGQGEVGFAQVRPDVVAGGAEVGQRRSRTGAAGDQGKGLQHAVLHGRAVRRRRIAEGLEHGACGAAGMRGRRRTGDPQHPGPEVVLPDGALAQQGAGHLEDHLPHVGGEAVHEGPVCVIDHRFACSQRFAAGVVVEKRVAFQQQAEHDGVHRVPPDVLRRAFDDVVVALDMGQPDARQFKVGLGGQQAAFRERAAAQAEQRQLVVFLPQAQPLAQRGLRGGEPAGAAGGGGARRPWLLSRRTR